MINVPAKTFVNDKKSVLSIDFDSMLAEELNESTNYEIPADFDFEQSKKKVYREAYVWLQEHEGNDLGTMSDKKFKSIIGEDNKKFMKILPDGMILTTVM